MGFASLRIKNAEDLSVKDFDSYLLELNEEQSQDLMRN